MKKEDLKKLEKINLSETPVLLTTMQLKEILGCNNNTLYALLGQSDFPSFRINSRYYIIYEDFIQWCRKQVRFTHKDTTNRRVRWK